MSKSERPEQYRSGVPTFTTATEEQQNTSEQLREAQLEHAELWFTACDAVRHDTQRGILTAIQEGIGGCTRQEIDRWVSVGDRAVRKHLQRLEERGLIERVDSRSHAVSYATFDVEVLVSHALDCYYA